MMLKIEKYLLEKFDYHSTCIQDDPSSKRQRKKYKKSKKRGVKLLISGENTTVDDVENPEDSTIPENKNPEQVISSSKPAHEVLKKNLKRKRKVDTSDLSGVIVEFDFKTKKLI